MSRPSEPAPAVRTSRLALLFVLLVIAALAGVFQAPAAQATITDSYANAFDLTSALTTTPFTFSDGLTDVSAYTRDAVEIDGLSACGSYPANPANTYSVWYSFTPAANGWLLLSTLNGATNYDTVIEVWSTAPQAANSIACNDDAIAGNRQSELNIQVAAATTYIIAIRRHGLSTMAAPTLAFDAGFSLVRELFVDQTTGNDANTGTQALPFRTIGKAASMLPAAGGQLSVLDPGTYNEAVTLGVPTILHSTAGPVSIAHVTLAATPIVATGSLSAGSVIVQPSALAQEGVQVAGAGATVSLADGIFTETVTIDKSLTLQALHDAGASLQPSSGPAIHITAGMVRVTGLNLQGDPGVLITGGSGHVITLNNLFANISGVALDNKTASQVDATRNWWGDRSGPPGDGDNALGDVVFRPWCDSAIPVCTNLVGAATQLRFTTSPASTVAGKPFAAQPVVEAVDDQGMLDSSFAGAVTLSYTGGTLGATLGGTATVNASGGIADFSGQGLNINYVGQNYRLTATSGAINSGASGHSAAFAITADRLIVTSPPADPTGAGTPLALSVAARDGFGHTDTTYTDTVALAIQINPTNTTLQGSAAKTATAGIAVFGGAGEAAIFKAGTGYTLRASSGSLATGDSAAFDITGGAGSVLVFSRSPSDSTAGVIFSTQPQVSVQDGFGNIDPSFNGTISLAIIGSTGTPGATLGGTTSMNASSGMASFSDLNITTAGSGYQLVASAGGFTNVASASFNIGSDIADTLAVVASPANTRAGVAFNTQPVIEALDKYGNRATGFSGPISLALKGGTLTATLGGTTSMSASSGVASFSGLSIDKIGAGYQLTASASGLTSIDTSSFDITANGLFFTLQPLNSLAGQSLLVRLAAQDGAGNTDTNFTGLVTLTLKGVGRAGPTLLGSTTLPAVNGVADFGALAGLNIQKAGVAYVLSANASGLAEGDSAAFDITAGVASQLLITAAPANAPADALLALAAEVQDDYGNLDTEFNGTVALAVQANPGGGTLGGTTAKAASGGLVSFGAAEGLNIDKVGVGYVLRASSPALAPRDTAPFTITANRLIFATSPGTSGVGALLRPAPAVQAVDRFGGVDTTFGGNVALLITNGTTGASLRGTATRAAANGQVTFDGVSVDRIGSGYQLSASASGLAGATSTAFDITRALTHLPIAIQPPLPDLLGSFKLSSAQVTPFEPIVISVTVTNTGEVAASQFWVDFYINPAEPPTAANQPWDKRCGNSRCKYGIAWYVDQTLAPGQSITLTSTRLSYFNRNTAWPGYFDTSKLNLYVYVDSWNQNISYGAVYERNEANNRAELHLGTAHAPPPLPAGAAEAPLPARPVRPGQ